METSKGEFDYGSTFNNLHCKNCNEWIGRTYRTTTPELDHIRGRFSFNLNSLIMFEISEIEQPTQSGSDQNSSGRNLVDQVEITKVKMLNLCYLNSYSFSCKNSCWPCTIEWNNWSRKMI